MAGERGANTITLKPIIPVLLLTLVNTLGFTIFIPVLPFMLRGWDMPDWTFGALLSAYSFCQFWAAPLFGQLSDQYGRRKLLLWSQAGTLVSWCLFVVLWFIESSWQVPALWLVLFLGLARLIDGITGGNGSVTNAYLSDVTTREQKAVYFGYLSAAMGVGMVIGPAIGAYTMATSWGYLATALFGVALSTITLLSIIWLLPESLKTYAEKKKTDWLKPFRVKSAFAALKSQPIIRNVLVIKLFLAATMGAYTSIMIFYLIDQIGLSKEQIGTFLFFVGGFAIFNQTVMIKPIVGWLGEPRALAFSMLLLCCGLYTFPWIDDLWVLVVMYYLCNLGFSLAIPTMKAVISNQTSDSHQGEILGLEESLNSLMFAIMPLVSTAVYGVISSQSFLIWASLSAFGLVYMLCVCPGVFRTKQERAL